MNKDFDYWKNLHETDKFEFGRQRLNAIDDLIKSAPEERQPALRRLQWQIDVIREANNPLAATEKISALMFERVGQLTRAIDSLNSAVKQAL